MFFFSYSNGHGKHFRAIWDNLNVLKDSSMLKRLNDIASFSKQEQEHILFALDAMITKIKLGSI